MPSHFGRAVRRFYWRHVRRHRYEICHSCGRPVHGTCPNWWRADDALWLQVVGAPEGLRCIQCFTDEADAKGLLLYWEPKVEPRPVVGEGLAALEQPCPFCQAPPGAECRTAGLGEARAPHNIRQRTAMMMAREADRAH